MRIAKHPNHKVYLRKMKKLSKMMALDPSFDSSKGQHLIATAQWCQTYEKRRFHFGPKMPGGRNQV